MAGGNEITDGKRVMLFEGIDEGHEVAGGFAHLLPVDGEHVIVHPVIRKGLAESFGL